MGTGSIPAFLFHFGFWASVISGAAFGLGFLSPSVSAEVLASYLAGCLVSSLVYTVGLGLVAVRKGRRWVVWVGLNLLLWPVAPIYTYIAMLVMEPIADE